MIYKHKLSSSIIVEEIMEDEKNRQEKVVDSYLTTMEGDKITSLVTGYSFNSYKGTDLISVNPQNGKNYVTTYIISRHDDTTSIELGFAKVGQEPYKRLNDNLLEVQKKESVQLYDLDKKTYTTNINYGKYGYTVTYYYFLENRYIAITAFTDNDGNILNNQLLIPEFKMTITVSGNMLSLIANGEIDALINTHLKEIKRKSKKAMKNQFKREFMNEQADLYVRSRNKNKRDWFINLFFNSFF